jgi:hypothetical protein
MKVYNAFLWIVKEYNIYWDFWKNCEEVWITLGFRLILKNSKKESKWYWTRIVEVFINKL